VCNIFVQLTSCNLIDTYIALMMQILMNVHVAKSTLATVNAMIPRVHTVVYVVGVTRVMEIQRKAHAIQNFHVQQSLR
jgi:hypothetical protein